jgi:hypothetical protein
MEKVKCELASLSPKARADVTNIVTQINSDTADAVTKKRVAQRPQHEALKRDEAARHL